jgi:hypothetical protein
VLISIPLPLPTVLGIAAVPRLASDGNVMLFPPLEQLDEKNVHARCELPASRAAATSEIIVTEQPLGPLPMS